MAGSLRANCGIRHCRRTRVNLEQVKTGMAWFYRYYQKELSAENRKLYAKAEDEARSERRGLWQGKNPAPPWG